MNRSHRLLLLLLAGLGCAQATAIRAQEAAEDGDDEKRVQYQLVLPDEKTPENVKPEEHNPFESESEAANRMSPGDTEENRVRDVLLRLKVAGTKRMADGRMQVLLGNIILETGKPVPKVLPDQQVELKVKNISPQAIELAWQEKRATGLPPKLMIIPISTAPRVRYQMLGQMGMEGQDAKGGVNATMDMPLRSLTTREPETTAAPVASSPPATPQEPQPLPAELVLDDPPVPAKAVAMEKEADRSAAPAAVPTPAPVPAPVTASSSPPRPTAPAVPSAAPMPAAAAAPTAVPPPVVQEEEKLPEPAEPVAPVPPPLEPPPAEPAPKAATPPPSPAVESLVRLLFGNPPSTPAPEPK